MVHLHILSSFNTCLCCIFHGHWVIVPCAPHNSTISIIQACGFVYYFRQFSSIFFYIPYKIVRIHSWFCSISVRFLLYNQSYQNKEDLIYAYQKSNCICINCLMYWSHKIARQEVSGCLCSLFFDRIFRRRNPRRKSWRCLWHRRSSETGWWWFWLSA